jgi:O-antigen ligase
LPGALAVFLFIGAGLVFLRPQNRVMGLVETDLSVMRGEKDVDQALHGRVWAWKRHWNYFVSESSPVERLVGLIGRKSPGLLGSGPHNDYLRIIYAAGFLGLGAYLFMLFLLFARSRRMPKSQRFLVRGMLLIILLMSVSTTPSFYVNINYIFMTVLAFIVLPRSLRVPQIAEA